jgi:hypothetical protein
MRLKPIAIGGLMLVALLATAIPSWAHHAFAAEFDAKHPVHFSGTLVRMEWINPHAWMHINVKAADGTETEWMIEAGTPNTLYRRGLTKASMPNGIEVVVDGYQAKDGSNRANGRDVTLPNGQKLFLGSTGTGAPYETKDTPKDK